MYYLLTREVVVILVIVCQRLPCLIQSNIINARHWGRTRKHKQ